MRVRVIERRDAGAWERMREALWPLDMDEHAEAVRTFFEGRSINPEQVLIACDDAGGLIGMVEMSIRNYAEGCKPGRVGYLEGWYVDPAWRRQGVGRALVRGFEDWARSQGCSEVGSDAAIDNADSAAAHRALGFDEVGRAVCFRKGL